MKTKLYRAGFLPYKIIDNTIHFMFMQPADFRYGGVQFQIAKGKIEEGETPVQAALREASEELGLLKENVRQVDLVGEYLGRTTVYMGEVLDQRNFSVPHFETLDTAWMTFHEFIIHGRPLHAHIVKDAYNLVNYHLTLR